MYWSGPPAFWFFFKVIRASQNFQVARLVQLKPFQRPRRGLQVCRAYHTHQNRTENIFDFAHINLDHAGDAGTPGAVSQAAIDDQGHGQRLLQGQPDRHSWSTHEVRRLPNRLEEGPNICVPSIGWFQGEKQRRRIRKDDSFCWALSLILASQLTPFVTENMRRTFGQYTGDKQGPKNASTYLARWKSENGLD